MCDSRKFQRVLNALNPAPKFYREKNWKSQFGYSMSSLKSKPELIAATARLYQEIFGNDPIWGEGAYCVREGWDKRISLSEYESLLAQNSCPVCSCGAPYQSCHPNDKVVGRLRELCDRTDAFVLILLDRDGMPCGFTWGTNESADDCIETVIATRYRNREVEGRRELGRLRSSLVDRCGVSGKVLYAEEVAVRQSDRSMESGMILCEAVLSQGLEGSGQGLFWTSSDTAIFQLSLGVNFCPFLTTSDGITFLLCRDLHTAVAILRSLSPNRYAIHCARVLRSQ